MGRTTSEEYLAKLEELESSDENLETGEMSEAERLAMLADKPKVRRDGQAVGSMHKRERPLSASQVAFANLSLIHI